jgi:hypothetical protein
MAGGHFKRTTIISSEPLSTRLHTVPGVAEARARLAERDAQSLREFILSLAHVEGPVGDQVRTFIIGDDLEDVAQTILKRLTRLQRPTEYVERHARGREVGVSLDLIVESIAQLVLPMDPGGAFDLLVEVFEQDTVAMDNCGDHHWQVTCAYERAARLMETVVNSLPNPAVIETLKRLLAMDLYGVREPLKDLLTRVGDR